jgi:hypothetical protein
MLYQSVLLQLPPPTRVTIWSVVRIALSIVREILPSSGVRARGGDVIFTGEQFARVSVKEHMALPHRVGRFCLPDDAGVGGQDACSTGTPALIGYDKIMTEDEMLAQTLTLLVSWNPNLGGDPLSQWSPAMLDSASRFHFSRACRWLSTCFMQLRSPLTFAPRGNWSARRQA